MNGVLDSTCSVIGHFCGVRAAKFQSVLSCEDDFETYPTGLHINREKLRVNKKRLPKFQCGFREFLEKIK